MVKSLRLTKLFNVLKEGWKYSNESRGDAWGWDGIKDIKSLMIDDAISREFILVQKCFLFSEKTFKQFGWCYTKVWSVVWDGGMPLNSMYHRELQPTEKLGKLFTVTAITPHQSWSDFSDQIMDIPYQIAFSDQIMDISYQIILRYHLFLRG